MLLTETDVRANEDTLRTAQLADTDALVVLDGAVEELVASADVVRADGKEARLLTGRSIGNTDDALAAARDLLDRSARLR